MRLLLSSDWHLTEKSEDEYKWGLFPWLAEMVAEHKIDCIIFGGDLTDAKDRHPARLVNRIVTAFAELCAAISPCEIIILKGNHDYVNPICPFFQVLSQIEGIYYVRDKQIIHGILCVSHVRDGISSLAFTEAELACPLMVTHETFSGAVASTGIKLDGESQEGLTKFKGDIISGDVHVPQQLGRVTYVGSPYRIRFNDAFSPRVLLYDKGKMSDVHFPCLRRHTVTIKAVEELRQQGFDPGDQVVVQVALKRSSFSEWPALVKQVYALGEELGVSIHGVKMVVGGTTRVRLLEDAAEQGVSPSGVTPLSAFEKFCTQESIDAYRATIGKDLLTR